MNEPKKTLLSKIEPKLETLLNRVISNESLEISQDSVTLERWCEHVLQLYVDYVEICNNLTLLVNSGKYHHQNLMEILDLVTKRCLLWQNELKIVEITRPNLIDNRLIAMKLTPDNLRLDLPGVTRAQKTPSRDVLRNITISPEKVGEGFTHVPAIDYNSPVSIATDMIRKALTETAEKIRVKEKEQLKYTKPLQSPYHLTDHLANKFAPPVLMYKRSSDSGKFNKKKTKSRKNKSLINNLLKTLFQKFKDLSENESPQRHIQEVSELQCNVEAPAEVVQKLHRSGMLSFGLQAHLSDYIAERDSSYVLLKNKLRFYQFAMSNHVDFPKIPKLCMVGEERVALKWLIECFAGEIDAVVINIAGAFEVLQLQDVGQFLDDLIDLAKALQPTLLILDKVHIFLARKKISRQMGTLVRSMIKKLDQEINNGHKILFIGISNEPWRGNLKNMRSVFSDFLWIPSLRYSATFCAWIKHIAKTLECHQESQWTTLASPLAWATRDISILTISEAVEQNLQEKSLRTSSQFVCYLTQAVKNLIARNNVQFLASAILQKKMKLWLGKAIRRRKGSRKSKKKTR